MEWTQTFTIISTLIASMVAVWYAFYRIIKEDIKRHDDQFSKMSDEFSKVHSLWASLLQKIYDVEEKFYTLERQIYEMKLDQSKKA